MFSGMLPFYLACTSAPAPSAVEADASAASPAVPAPEGPSDLVFRGASDASAAVWGPDGRLWVADDEGTVLQTWDPSGGAPGAPMDLGLGKDEADLEGAAAIGDRRWWIGSHGRNKDAKARPARQVFLETDATGHVLGKTNLLPAFLALPGAGPALTAAEPSAPKEGGVCVEGLAASPDGALWIGFRSPLSADGRAWVVRLARPEAALSGPPAFDAPIQLDLDHRGVRSMEWDAGRQLYWIVAGPPGKVGDFALYSWTGPGAPPLRVVADLRELNPEALLVNPDGSLLLLSDDGTRPNGKGINKDAPPERRTFRGRRIVPG